MPDHTTPPSDLPSVEHLDDVARRLGIDAFTDTQVAAIGGLAAKRDVLVVMPTGAGKSAVYQAAGELLPGATVVVSPLLALQRDQVDHLDRTRLADARRIDGSTGDAERTEILNGLRDGSVQYLFVTPETLLSPPVLDPLADAGVSLFVVDEAHCIVTWGSGFRQDYAMLGDARRCLGSPVTVALTATADPRMRSDIARSLDMHDHDVLVGGLERTNIDLALTADDDEDRLRSALVDHVRGVEGTVVVYVARRRDCEDLAAELDQPRRRAMPYHAGLRRPAKQEALEALAEGPCVVVATNAFGMGVDVADIRSVVHLDLPESLVTYYQEVGRAGRDGRPATGHVFTPRTRASRRGFAGGVQAVDVAACRAVEAAVRSGASSRRRVVDAVDVGAGAVNRAIDILHAAGVVAIVRGLRCTGEIDDDALAERCRAAEEFERTQRSAVETYRSTLRCRWSQLLATFGEALTRCGHCDVCADDVDVARAEDDRVGRSCMHEEFGVGTVVAVTDDTVTVAFDDVGPKSLDAAFCWDEGGLELTS